MSIVWYFAALVVLIALSAFFSASEMSYSSANRLRLENAAEDGDRRAKTAVGILDHFDRTLSAILIGNNLVNIASSSLGSVIVILLAGEQWTWVSTVVLTLLVIIFGETMPKIVAKQNANGIALRNAYIIRALSVILYPVIWLVVGLVHLITRPLHGDAGDGDPEEAASQELQSIIETAEDEDVLDEDRSELLRSALDFSDVSASEAMTARVDMVAIDIDDDWDEIVRIINDSSYSRLPVYSGSVDNIIGFLYLNRFFKAMMDGRPDDLRAQLIPPCFVYKTTRLPDVLAKLRREQKHLAVVTDEFGGTLGVIPHLNPAPRKVYLINETNETTEELFAHERRLYEVQWLRMHGVNIFDEANVEQIDSHSVRVSCEGEEGSTILRVDHIVVVGDREANAELQNELTELGIPFEAAGSMKFKAPFGTAGEAALDGIYVLQALEKRSL